MSQKRNYQLNCRKCGGSFPADLYESVDVAADPGLKEQLMLNQLNTVECPHCHLRFRVDKPLLYSDPRRRILIYWLPVAEGDFEDGEEQFRSWMGHMAGLLPDNLPAPNVQLVFSRPELVERIFLSEAGLNERIIEYIKYGIYTKNNRRVPPDRKALLFNAQDSTEEFLCFVIQDVASRQLEAVLHYPRATYQALRETFDAEEKSADLLEMFPGPYVSARALVLRELAAEETPANGDTRD